MIKYKYKIFLTLLFISSLGLSAQEKMKLSLEKALQLGDENSKVLSSSKAKIKAANAKVNEANAGGLPSLKFAGSYTRLSPVEEFKFPFTIPGTENFSLFPILLNSTNLQLNLQQPIFTGNKISGSKEAAEFMAKASEVDYTRDKSETGFGVKNAYWNLKKAQMFKKLADENLNQMKAHLEDVEKLVANGLATDNDKLKIEVQLNESMLRQLDAQNMVQIANVALNNMLGLNLSTEVEVETEPNQSNSDKGNLSVLVEKAFKQRPELISNEYRLKATEKSIEVTKGNYYPQVAFAGNLTYANPNQRLIPSQDKFYATWSLSLNVSYDIWNWNTTQYQVEQAESQLVQAKDGIGQIKDGIVLEITQNYLSYSQNKKKISISEFATKQAQENLRVTNEKFKNGMALSSDIIDAELTLLQSKTNLLQTLIDLEIAYAKLDKSIGE